MITTDINKVIYVSDGITTEYDFSFTVYDKSHLKVYIQSPDTNKSAVLEETNYNVVLNEDYSGGKIILNQALLQNTKISIIREVDKTQEVHYIEGSPFPAQSHERALDKLTMIAQQLDEKVSRIPQSNVFGSGIDFDDLYNSIQYCSNNIEALAKSISITVNTIKDLIALDTANLIDKTAVLVLGYHEPNDGGGGIFYWDTQKNKSNHNGGIIIDPTAIFPTDWDDITQQSTWFNSSNTGNGCWVKIYKDSINVKWFGAIPHKDITNIIDKIFSLFDNIKIDDVYYISSIVFPPGKTVDLNYGRLIVKANQTLRINCNIIADDESWIFDCEDTVDEVTNFSNTVEANGPIVFTKVPITFQNPDGSLTYSMNKRVSVKWFGATGKGLNTTTYNNYLNTTDYPESEYVDDTKAIRLALTALANEQTNGAFAGSSIGPATLYFPPGVYCVTKPLYVSGGTNLIGEAPVRPNRATELIQVNVNENLLVLQARGIGGLSGGGSSHVIKDMTLGYRPCQVSSYKNVITFEDNRFNLDSSFHNIRFSGCSAHGAIFYVNKKNARSSNNETNPEYGYGDEEGLEVSLHVYDCMFDGGIATVFLSDEYASFSAEVFNSLIWYMQDGLVRDVAKNTQAPNNGKSVFNFYNCEISGCGTPPNSIETYRYSVYGNNSNGYYNFHACTFNNVSNNYGGGIKLTAGKELIIRNCKYDNTINSTEARFMYLDGYINTFILTDCIMTKHNQYPNSILQLTSNFYSDYLYITNNIFRTYSNDSLSGLIYTSNPATPITNTGKISDNVFYGGGRQAIYGNLNPNIHLVNNIFTIDQDFKSISSFNYGMKHRKVEYRYSVPSTGNYYKGDIIYNANPTAGGNIGWVCIESGSPGTWKAFGTISS